MLKRSSSCPRCALRNVSAAGLGRGLGTPALVPSDRGSRLHGVFIVCHHALQALQDPGTGLLVNERLVNAPPQVAPPLMQALFDEISWAVEDEPTQACTADDHGMTGCCSGSTALLCINLHCARCRTLTLLCPRHASATLLMWQERQDSFKFTQYLLIASAYRDPQAASEEAAQKSAKPAKKRPKVKHDAFVSCTNMERAACTLRSQANSGTDKGPHM